MTKEIKNLAKETVSNISRLTNSFSSKENLDEILHPLLNEHRTLNQSFTGNFIIPFVREMAKKHENQNFDLRNQAACEFCSVMWNALKEKYNLDGNREFSLPLI